MAKLKDLTGKRFGRLTVLKFDGIKKSNYYWLCKCDCGKTKSISSTSLKSGLTKSCGCIRIEKSIIAQINTTHHETNTRLYKIWTSMKERCYRHKDINYRIYGQRGIKVCEEWKNSFENFRDWAIASGYQEKLTIDRIDVNKNYEPTNCRWATPKEQANNKTNNIFVKHNGEVRTLAQWSEFLGIKYQTLYTRYRKYKKLF